VKGIRPVPDIGAQAVRLPLLKRRPVHIFQGFYAKPVIDGLMAAVIGLAVLVVVQAVKETVV
jgi:hypothetical protein